MGPQNTFITTGFSKTSDRQVNVWDFKNLSNPLKQEQIDTASGYFYFLKTKIDY